MTILFLYFEHLLLCFDYLLSAIASPSLVECVVIAKGLSLSMLSSLIHMLAAEWFYQCTVCSAFVSGCCSVPTLAYLLVGDCGQRVA